MTDSLRSSIGGVFAELSRSFGTFVGLAWLCVVVGMVVARAAALSIRDVPVPHELLWIGVFVVALLGTGWLADGGYERLGADPRGGGTFAWLALFFVPFAFLPLRFALGVLTELQVFDYLFVLATILFAGWLAFYGGLERLGLTPDDFIRVIVYVVALGAVTVGAVVLFDAAWPATDLGAATVAVALQLAACWLGFTRDSP